MSDVLPLFRPAPAAAASTTPSITVAQVVAEYLAIARTELEPKTHADKTTLLGRFVAAFGGRLPDTLRPSEVKAWVHAQVEWKSDNTRRKAHNAIRAVFHWAARDRLIPFDPVAGHTLPAGQRRAQTADEAFRALLRLADACFARYAIFLRLTGCRPQDGRNADWEHLDRQRRLVVIPPELHKTGKATGESKLVVLTPPAWSLVCWLERHRPEPLFSPTGPILTNSRGRRWTESAVQQRMAELRKLGLPKCATLHGLRHGFASAVRGRGGNIKDLADVLGHSQTSTTEAFYLHIDAEAIAALHRTAQLGLLRGN